jgi:2-methylcitrate dehydratase PrpD
MVTRELVSNCLKTTYESIPEEVILHAKKSILNWMGVAIGGSRHTSVEIFLDVKKELQSSEQVSILGRNEKADLLWATLINGTSSHVFDFDDAHLVTLNHPSSAVAPACFALAEKLNVSGKQVLRAFVLGMEADLRIGNAISPSHYDSGWHITATTGVFGSAIAAGILLDLNEEQMIYALGIAGTQAFGLLEMLGTMTKLFHPGKAAQNGLWAALLAKRGFESSKQILEAKKGFANVLAPKHNLELVNINWGSQWEILNNAFKPYACGIVLHPIIDACIALGQQIDPAQVKEIELIVNKYVMILTGKPEPKTGLEGKYSVHHVAALAFYDGDAAAEQFTDAKVFDPKILEFKDKIKPIVDESMKEDEVVVKLTTIDGQVIEYKVDHAIGSIDNPMTDEHLCRKFKKLTTSIIGDDNTNAIIEKLYALDSEANLNQIISYCTNL